MRYPLISRAVLALCAMAVSFAQPGGFGRGGGGQRLKLLPEFDKAGKGYLSSAERKAAREYLATQPRRGRGFGRSAGNEQGPPAPGPHLTPADVKTFGSESLYDQKVLRTFFLEFENADWEKELADFYHTDVDVPAKLTVDGKLYPDVGVHFRGQSSYSSVSEGRKRSLDLSLHMVHADQGLI